MNIFHVYENLAPIGGEETEKQIRRSYSVPSYPKVYLYNSDTNTYTPIPCSFRDTFS